MERYTKLLFIKDCQAQGCLLKAELEAAFAPEPLTFVCFSRLEKGLDYLEVQRDVRAVLLELTLPDSQGLETLSRVLTAAPQIPVIVITQEVDEQLGMMALQAGAQDYVIEEEINGKLLARSIRHSIQRKQTELQLADALEFTGRIVNSAPVGIFTYRLSGECLSANPAAAHMVGGTVEQLRDQNFHHLESWKRSGLYEMARQTISTGNSTTADLHITTTFGRDAWYTAQFVLFRSGGEDLLLMMFVDITKRKQAEGALRERETLLNETQAISHVGSWELDLVNNHLRWSDEVFRMFGVAVHEFEPTYQAVLETVHPDDRAVVDESFCRSVREGGDAYEIEHRIIRCDNGEICFVHEKCKHIRNAEGQVIRSLGMVQDITERKRAEASLRASQRFTQQALDALTSHIAILDESGTIVAVNRSWRDFAQANGADPARVSEGVNYLAVCHATQGLDSKEAASVAEGIRAVMEGRQNSHVIEYACHSPTEKRWFMTRVTKFKDTQPVRIVVSHDYITERKEAEAALAASEKRFRTWIEHSSDIISVLGADGVIHYQSPSVKHLLGYDVEELQGRNAFDYIHPEDRTSTISSFAKTIENPNTTLSTEFRFRHRDGSWRLLEGIGRTYVDEDNAVVGLIHSRDITERRMVENAVASMQKRFQALIENAPDGIALLRMDWKLRQVTPSTQQILGYSVEDAQGRDPGSLTHPDDLPALLALLEELIQHPGKVIQAQYRFRHKNGSWRWLESTISNMTAEPSVEALVFNYRDITERKQSEEALRDSETRYRALMESSLEAIYMYSLNSKQIFLANPAFLELLGYQAHEIQQLTVYDVVANDRVSIDIFFEKILATGGISMGERLWRRKDGTIIQMEVTANKIKQEDADVIFVVGRDITERKRVEQALQEKGRLLSEAQRIGHIGSWSYTLDRDSMIFSDEMYRLLDILPEEFHHDRHDFLALVYPSDRLLATRWMDGMKDGSQSKDLNFRIFHKNGELRYLHCSGAMEFDSSPRPIRFIGTMQDVSERRVAEIQINQQIQRLTALREIDRAILSSFDEHYILGVILSHAVSQLQVDAADLLVVEPDGESLRYAAGQGFRTNPGQATQIQMGELHARRAAMERRMIRIPDLRDMTNLPAFNQFVMQEGFVSYVGMPLVVKGKVKGVLEVYQRSTLQPYQEWLDFFYAMAGQAAIAIENVSLFANLETTNRELIQAYDATIEGWSRAMDLRDRESEGHTQRVTSLTLALARAMGIDEHRLVHLRRGALLHDIGKLGVPDHVLFKPGALTEEERELIEMHVDFSYEMLAPIPYLKPALNIPYFHHEKWDGTGYPLELKGEQIPLEARIFAVVDVWDALLSDRPFRQAWTRQQAIEYIRTHAGTHFDPRVVEYFLKIVKE